VGAFFEELLNVGIYKRSQGRITRQVTFAALAILFALGFWTLSNTLSQANWATGKDSWANQHLFGINYWLPGLLLLVFWWVSFRIVNLPNFADFLIAVEAEMNKVSWPTRSELFKASLVVLICIISMAAVLYIFDVMWAFIFTFLHIM
jgi:preprotein translocase subunit SecE